MRPLKVGSEVLISFVGMVFFIYFVCRIELNSIFGVCYGLMFSYSFCWALLFYSVSGIVDEAIVFFLVFHLFVPSFVLYLASKYFNVNYGFLTPVLNSFSTKIRVEIVISIILFVVSLLIYKKMGFSFSFDDSYVRRIDARIKISGILAYLFSMSMNGLGPILAFLSIYNSKRMYFIVALLFSICSFGFVGVKAPIVFVFLMAALGLYLRRGGKNIVLIFVSIMFCLVCLALFERVFLGFSWIADIYVRRGVLVVSQLQMYFSEYFYSNGEFFNYITGFVDDNKITYLVGERYFGSSTANANTIVFFTELGNRGLLGYFMSISFIVFFFGLLTYMYKVSRHGVWMAIAVLYTLVLLEQSFTTAFVSSGIGLVFVLLLLFRYAASKR